MKNKRPLVTRKRLMELLDYDHETGEFIRKTYAGGTAKVGSSAGTINDRGYRSIRIDGRFYYAHRLAFLYTYGYLPTGTIDHINGKKDDNRINNLREVTKSENAQNVFSAHRDSRSGVLGVSELRNGRWAARISINGKRKNLGCYSTKEIAEEKYLEAKKLHHQIAFKGNREALCDQ